MNTPYGTIYGLYDLNGELRYIGQTQGTLARRLSGHLCAARYRCTTYVACWVSSLLRVGVRPKIRPLAIAESQDELNQLEVRFIADARNHGVRITNHHDGGEGAPGRQMSAAHRAKLHNLEVWAKMSATRKGQPSPRKGVVLSAKTRAKISIGKLGKPSGRFRQDVSTDAILQGIREGKSTPQIATELGIDRHTVLKRYHKAAQAGVAVPELNPTTFKHSEEAKHRIGQASVGRKRSEAVKAKISATKTKIPTDLILRRLAEGVSVSQLAQEAGVDRSTIYLRLKKARDTANA